MHQNASQIKSFTFEGITVHPNFPKSRIKGESDGPENIFLDKTMQNMTLPFNTSAHNT